MQRAKALPLHSSPGCRTLFREGRSTKYWLNEVSQRHISKSEIKPSTPTESQVSLGKPHSRDKARQTGNLPVQYVNPKKWVWAEFKKCKVCKPGFYKTCAGELTTSPTPLQSTNPGSFRLAPPTQSNTKGRCKAFSLLRPVLHTFSLRLQCLLVLKIVKEANWLSKPAGKRGFTRSISEGWEQASCPNLKKKIRLKSFPIADLCI